jgi:hypothetical protein
VDPRSDYTASCAATDARDNAMTATNARTGYLHVLRLMRETRRSDVCQSCSLTGGFSACWIMVGFAVCVLEEHGLQS